MSALLCLSTSAAVAFEQPSIVSPRDKSCRDEAAGKVFETPDPESLGPHAIGKQIYFACMDRFAEAGEDRQARPPSASPSRVSRPAGP